MAVVGKTAGDLSARAETFSELAQIHIWRPPFTKLNIVIRAETPAILSETYFALSEAYKRQRNASGSLTEWPKAAALVAASVAVVDPLRPDGPADHPFWPYINPSFAVLCAYGHARHMFEWRDWDEQRRFYQSLRNLRLPCLDPIITEGLATKGKFTTTWEIVIPDAEMSYLDLLVSYFGMLQDFDTLKRQSKR